MTIEDVSKAKTILVVDDDDDLRDALAFCVSKSGHKVLQASGGREAIELVKHNPIDVVISDIRMPDGDGVELLKTVKALHPELPVMIFISGFSDLTLDEAYNLGASAIFSKPFDTKALLNAVQTALTPRETRWIRRPERVATELSISYSVKDMEQTIKGKLLNIGLGGLFIKTDLPLPKTGDMIDFRLSFGEGNLKEISGSGVVRWARESDQESGPRGFGLEFKFISDPCRTQILELINMLKTATFIPKN